MTSRTMAVRCSATSKQSGLQCKSYAIPGGTVCRKHGGGAPQVKAKAGVVAELFAWGLKDTTEDPGEVLLRLVTQSSRRCAFYASLIEQAYDAAERLAENTMDDLGGLILPDDQARGIKADQAREQLDRVFLLGGVSALVGGTYGAAKDVGVYQTGEAIRGLVDLESKERDRCANFATKAVAAGLAERQVRLAEQQGAAMFTMVKKALSEVTLTPEQSAAFMASLARQARELGA